MSSIGINGGSLPKCYAANPLIEVPALLGNLLISEQSMYKPGRLV